MTKPKKCEETMEIDLDPKYQALLEEAERQDLADQDSMRVCAQTLTLAAMIDRRRAAALAPQGLSEGRFILLFLLCLLAGLMSTPVLSWLVSPMLG